jgi:hypothetical protein
MHPEIVSNIFGQCSRCGMKLVLKEESSSKTIFIQTKDRGLGKITWRNYIPLMAIIGSLVAITLGLGLQDFQTGVFSIEKTLTYFMIGFFLTFAGFKLIDLKGFAEGYSTYDLLARKYFAYGYIYPFIELFFGVAMIFTQSTWLLAAEILRSARGRLS